MSQTHSENRTSDRDVYPKKQTIKANSDLSYQVKIQTNGQFKLVETSPQADTSEKDLFDYFGSMKGYWGDPDSFIAEIRSDRDSSDR